MPHTRRVLIPRFITCLLVGLAFQLRAAPAAAEVRPQEPRLVVLIVIDQLRADFLTRFEKHFGDGGFRRLMRQGAHFTNAYYSYGATATAPGHATVSTGNIPRGHGIVANKWYLDPAGHRAQYAVEDDGHHSVPEPADGGSRGRSPHRLIGPTLGDQIKIQDVRSRVFSVALKDRAAIFLGGHQADGAFWWNARTGQFVSSSYYGEELPNYVRTSNEERTADNYLGKVWRPALPPDAYAGCQPVDPNWPGNFMGLGSTFPHVLPEAGSRFYTSLMGTPFGNDIVLDMARRILTHQKLGQGPALDMLCIGLSSNDICGHYFGPESPEVLDLTVRTDAQIARLLTWLDKYVGLDRCVIALTGDHGVTTIPQISQRLGLGGGNLDLRGLCDGLNERLAEDPALKAEGLPKGNIVLGAELPWVYLNRPLLAAVGAQARSRLLRTAAEFFRSVEGVAAVLTADELEGPMPPREDVDRYLAWRGYHRERSGQLFLRLLPYWYKIDSKPAGHTSGFNHDRHVPILMFGPRIEPGRYFSPARPCDIAVTLSALLGIEPPLGAAGAVLHEAIDARPAP